MGDEKVYIIYADSSFEELGDDFYADNIRPTDLDLII